MTNLNQEPRSKEREDLDNQFFHLLDQFYKTDVPDALFGVTKLLARLIQEGKMTYLNEDEMSDRKVTETKLLSQLDGLELDEAKQWFKEIDSYHERQLMA